MQAAFKTLLGLAIVLAVVVVARAEDDKSTKKAGETTIKGELGCAKCVFKVKGVKTCKNAIKDKESGDIFILEDAGAKAPYHGKICTDKAEGCVVGVVNKAKKTIKPSKDGVKFD